MQRLPDKATLLTQKRYQRISSFYNLMEILPERIYAGWRKNLWLQVKGSKILEVGVGTGKNIPYYPPDTQITAIDLTPGMLVQAKKKAHKLNRDVDIRQGDAQKLDFPDSTFDTVIATFVFCSVPDPILGFQELFRVLKPDGQIFLLEHMRAKNTILGFVMDVLNPIIVRMMGVNINRDTVKNIEVAGLGIEKSEDLESLGIYKSIRIAKSAVRG